MKCGKLSNGGTAEPITTTWQAPRCEAKSKRSGVRCRNRSTRWSRKHLKRGLCRMHGGAKRSGKVTREGLKRIAAAATKHGHYTVRGKAKLKRERQEARRHQRAFDKAHGIKRRSGGGPDVTNWPRDAKGRFL
jgi:hypothetical protein